MNEINLSRIEEQEGSNVKYWFEDIKNNIVVTLVSGYFPNEMNVRISDNLDRFEIRGHRSIMDKETPEYFKKMAIMHINRHRSMKK